MLQARSPLGLYDSLALARGGEGAAGGFDGALAHTALVRRPIDLTGGPRAIGDLMLAGGTAGYDDNALWIRRADSLVSLEAGAESWTRNRFGPYDNAGRHQYGLGAGLERGGTRVEGAVAQRGGAGALVGGEEQSANSTGGYGGVGLRRGRHDVRLTLGRSYDTHESFAVFLPRSRRDARENWGSLEWRRDSLFSARLDARDARVARTEVGSNERDWQSKAMWLTVGAEAHGRTTVLHAQVGAGKDQGTNQTEVAPSIALHLGQRTLHTRLFTERILTSVWSDLAPGESPFLQSTWAGGFDIEWADSAGRDARLGWIMGRTRDRALIQRLPLEDLWLRAGARRDVADYDFGLATVAASMRGQTWGAGAEAFVLIRDASHAQPRVDPGEGARGFLEGRFRLFKGDLGVRVRAGADVVGERESEAPVPRLLPAAVTFNWLVNLALADAVVTLRVNDLSDERPPQTWIDNVTGLEALSPGRELQLSIGWRFFN